MATLTAQRADHEGGHVAMAVVPYCPTWRVSADVRRRWSPWQCVFHDEPGGPKSFVTFGGRAGMIIAVREILGPPLCGPLQRQVFAAGERHHHQHIEKV